MACTLPSRPRYPTTRRAPAPILTSVPVVGVLTAGGDCPGLNAAIRAVVVRVAAEPDGRVVGILNGWEGLMEGTVRPLGRDDVRGILARGGTILGTSRKDPYLHGEGLASVLPTLKAEGIDRLVVIGGDGSLRTAARLADEDVSVVGIPKTIDNDIAGTDYSFGFDTAIQVVSDAIDRLTTTAEAHHRIIVLEVMGRTTGWIAVYGGIAGGAEAILVPEEPYDLADLADRLRRRHEAGHTYSIVVVAEGVPDPSGAETLAGVDAYGFARLGGVATEIGPALERLTGYETRVTILGHLQRGGTPTAFDRVLATRMGLAAAEACLAGASGVMVGVRGSTLTTTDLWEGCAEPRLVPSDLLAQARWFFA